MSVTGYIWPNAQPDEHLVDFFPCKVEKARRNLDMILRWLSVVLEALVLVGVLCHRLGLYADIILWDLCEELEQQEEIHTRLYYYSSHA